MADFGVMLAAKFEHSKDNHVGEAGAIHRALSSFSFPVKRPSLRMVLVRFTVSLKCNCVGN